ncbi:MAG TPA: hypothetical protein VFZ27_13845 [Terriglobia bacterium]|nr:hypothetical protein [Terriglobia bacterium]
MNFKNEAAQSSCRPFVSNGSSNRKVLTVADESAIRNLLTLARKLDSRRVVTANTGLDISTINRKSFDTAILDLRCSQGRPAGRGYGVGEVRPSMVGRVLVINAEVNDQQTFEAVERYIYHRHTIEGLLFDLARLVRSLLGHSPSPNEI